MKILVLGGTGAMGEPVVKILAERKHQVCVTTRQQRSSKYPNVRYVTGDAHDLEFLRGILTKRYDAIIDFMVYRPEEFAARRELLLKNTEQYMFFSSARVYADTRDSAITEGTPRLLDVMEDKSYLATNEYALAKAREENLLINGQEKNYTIIRPYITYNDERLQLGVMEKEMWLKRALEGKAIVFSKDIAQCETTLTYGEDVALRIAGLVGNEKAMGEVFQIAMGEPVRWSRVLEIYLEVMEEKLGRRPRVYWLEEADLLAKVCGNFYQIHYDRLYHRRFDSAKVERAVKENKPYVRAEEGLRICLSNFLDGIQRGTCGFTGRNWKAEGVCDRLTGDCTKLAKILGWKNKVKYVLGRYGVNF